MGYIHPFSCHRSEFENRVNLKQEKQTEGRAYNRLLAKRVGLLKYSQNWHAFTVRHSWRNLPIIAEALQNNRKSEKIPQFFP